LLTVVITGVGFPGDEGQGGVTAAKPPDPPTRAQHVHLDRLGRQPKEPRDLLALPMLGDQAQDLPLPRGELFEAQIFARLDHGHKMVRGSPYV
jgi:hypothetical protein